MAIPTYTLVALSALLAFSVTERGLFAQSKEVSPNHTPADWAPPADWTLIDFGDGYELKRVTIEVRSATKDDYATGRVVGRWNFTGKEDLQRFAGALRTVRIQAPSRSKGAFGVTPIARIECTTNRGAFSIYWNRTFVLDSTTLQTNNSFKSMALAALIDRKLREQGHEGLSEEQIDNLSGLRQLKQERLEYGQAP